MALVVRKVERPHGPRRIQFRAQGQFVLQHPHAIGRWMF
jgi:hypothetical protein